jgi:hypothetical protein
VRETRNRHSLSASEPGGKSLRPDRFEWGGAYASERQIFGPLAPRRREFPLDLAMWGLAGSYLVILMPAVFGLAGWLPIDALFEWISMFVALGVAILTMTLATVAVRTRRRRGRW